MLHARLSPVVVAWGASPTAPWAVVAGLQGPTAFLSAYLPHAGRPDAEWSQALRDLDDALGQAGQHAENMLLMGDLNMTDMYGSPHRYAHQAETTEKDFERKEQLLSVLEAHHLHHLDQATRRQATNQGYAAHMHPKIFDYAFGTDKLRRLMTRAEQRWTRQRY